MAKQTLLQIPTPCSQNWEEMYVVHGGRFCGSCEKKVIDFSLMSDRQILEILRNSKGEVCGRFVNEQLNRNLAVSSQQSNALIPAVLISTALMTATAVHATAEKKLPAMEQDTLKPGLDSMVYSKSLMPLDNSALFSKLLVNEVPVSTNLPYTMGAVIKGIQIETLPEKRWRDFWGLLWD
jgi:hypothetical protein